MAKKIICPLLKKPCIEHECAWWTTVRGYDINTGMEIDNQQCVVTTVPLLMIENSAQQRSTASAVESLRNETIDRTDITNKLLANVIVSTTISELPSAEVPFAELPPS